MVVINVQLMHNAYKEIQNNQFVEVMDNVLNVQFQVIVRQLKELNVKIQVFVYLAL